MKIKPNFQGRKLSRISNIVRTKVPTSEVGEKMDFVLTGRQSIGEMVSTDFRTKQHQLVELVVNQHEVVVNWSTAQ